MGWLPKASDDGARVAAGPEPLPVSATVCGLSLALSVSVRVPV